MFRAYIGPSSGGTTVCIQQLVLLILFRHTKRIISTNSCIHTVVPPGEGPTLLLLLLLLSSSLLTAIGLSPGGSGYFTCIQNMKLVTKKFKSGGLHEKHVVATWNFGNHLSICL